MGHTDRAPLTPFRPDTPGRDSLTSMVSDPVSIFWVRDQRSDRAYRKVYESIDVVYFIRAADAVKIGTTSQLVRRFTSLQGESPLKLTLFGLIYGDRAVEAWCHQRCIEHRKHNEWFHWNPWTERFVAWLLEHGDHAAEGLGLTKRTDWLAPLPRQHYRGSRADRSKLEYIKRAREKDRGLPFGSCKCERCADQPWERW